jgi:hypothetical protein
MTQILLAAPGDFMVWFVPIAGLGFGLSVLFKQGNQLWRSAWQKPSPA